MQFTITPMKFIVFVIIFAALVYGANELMNVYWDWRDSVEALSM
jgi:hypothetical protein